MRVWLAGGGNFRHAFFIPGVVGKPCTPLHDWDICKLLQRESPEENIYLTEYKFFQAPVSALRK